MKLGELDYKELLSYLTGVFLMNLGAGHKVRDLIDRVVSDTLNWQEERAEFLRNKEKGK